MANIKISNLTPAGSELFTDAESFLTDIQETDASRICGAGGKNPAPAPTPINPGNNGGGQILFSGGSGSSKNSGNFFYTPGGSGGGQILFSGGNGKKSKNNGNFFYTSGSNVPSH